MKRFAMVLTLLCLMGAGAGYGVPAAAAPSSDAAPAEAARAIQSVSAPIPLRGVIEGFYGTPWTFGARMDMIDFCGKHGFNAYIYAPKDDPYHRAKWREPYPAEKMRELQALVSEAKTKGVRLIFAVSPGLDLHFRGAAAEADRTAMLGKLEAVYALGVRDFAIFFDDIKEKDGAGQAAFLNAIARELHARHGDIGTILTVPTEYYLADMRAADGSRKAYTDAFFGHLDVDILVLYTGDGVVVPALTDADYRAAAALCGRSPGIWWNYPVTDYMEGKLALGPITGLPRASRVPAIFFNPMKYERLSKIALATGADYARDPAAYDAQGSWERAIRAQYGALAPAMEAFADQSQHMENAWAKAGRMDGAKLRAAIAAYEAAWPAGKAGTDGEAGGSGNVGESGTSGKAGEAGTGGKDAEACRAALDAELASLDDAAAALQQGLPEETLAECAPQLARLRQMAQTARLGLSMREAARQGQADEARRMRLEGRRELAALRNQKDVQISEQTLSAFLEKLFGYTE